MFRQIALAFLCFFAVSATWVQLGVDRLAEPAYSQLLVDKRIGLITNHTGVNNKGESTISVLKEEYDVVALFGPEHGVNGNAHAGDEVASQTDRDGLPIYSLYGANRRPTDAMLEGIDVLVYDIQDIGARCYTYASTLFYVMEEAAKRKIPVVVLDRPNPINGVAIDGPMLDESRRSFVGYIDVPFCHGMTIGELAQLFNAEYSIGCDLKVIPMNGWKREMTYRDTGLPWVPTSPQIPDPETCQTYPATVILGECMREVSIGVGYTLPFKLIGAPWMDGEKVAAALNKQAFPGVVFRSHYFCPFFGRHAKKDCKGVRIIVTDSTAFKPISTQFLIMGVLKTLYPDHFAKGIPTEEKRIAFLAKIAGSDAIYQAMQSEGYIAWDLIAVDKERRDAFAEKRKPYLLYK